MNHVRGQRARKLESRTRIVQERTGVLEKPECKGIIERIEPVTQQSQRIIGLKSQRIIGLKSQRIIGLKSQRIIGLVAERREPSVELVVPQ